jgi:hypothetical protein
LRSSLAPLPLPGKRFGNSLAFSTIATTSPSTKTPHSCRLLCLARNPGSDDSPPAGVRHGWIFKPYDPENGTGDPIYESGCQYLDLYFNDIVPEENLNGGQNHHSSFVSNAGGVSGMISTDDSLHPLDPSLLHELYKRIAPGVPSDIHLDQLPPRSHLSSQFGLNNFNNWKLTKEFGQKYHFLDCNSGMWQVVFSLDATGRW